MLLANICRPMLVALVVAGCGGSEGSPATSPAPSLPPTPDTTAAAATPRPSSEPLRPQEFVAPELPATGVDALRRPDGTWSTETLLRWWARSIAPIEGVTPLDAAVVRDASNRDLIQALVPRARELPEPVAQGLTMWTNPREGFGLLERVGEPGDLSVAEAERLVAEATTEIERWLGEPLGVPVTVTVHNHPRVFDRPFVGAMAVADYDALGLAGCTVHVRSVGGPVVGLERWRHSAILHELYHCYQYRLVPDHARTESRPAWIGEGTASWVGEKLSGGSRYSEGWMQQWLVESGGQLGARSYDAIGLGWLLEQAGVPIKERFDAMLLAEGDFDRRFAAAMGPDERVADRVRSAWGSHIWNQAWGERWHPAAAAHAPADARAPVTPFNYSAGGAPALLRSRGTRAAAFSGTTSGDLLQIITADGTWGAARDPDGAEFELRRGTINLCLVAQACMPCPTTGEFPLGGAPQRAASGEWKLGIMTQNEGSVTLIGSQWATECGEEPTDVEPPTPPPHAATVCTERVPLEDFRRLTGENYADAYEGSRDQCLFADARYEQVVDIDASPLEMPASKATALQKDIFVTSMAAASRYREIRSGLSWAAVSPDGTSIVGVSNGKQFFATTRSRRITTDELVELVKFYLTTF